MKKNLMIILITFIILSLTVIANNDWVEVGSDSGNSYVQDNGQTFVSENITLTNDSISSLTQPLIADLNNDGVNEIIIFRSGEIRLYSSANYNLIDTYINNTIDISGNAEIIDFDGDGFKELFYITNTVGTNYSIHVLTYNASIFRLDKVINGVRANSGLNCQDDFYSDKLSCCYVGIDGEYYCYDDTNNFNTSHVTTLGGDDCLSGSIPYHIDFTDDGRNDVIFIYGSACNEVRALRNNNDGSFDLIYNLTTQKGINEIAIANLDGGVKELVVTDSHYCSDSLSTVCDGSTVSIFKIDDGTPICTKEFEDEFGVWNSPYLTGLHTCEGDEGGLNCDYDSNSYNNIYVLRIYADECCSATTHIPSYITVIDKNCNVLFEQNTSFLNNTFISSAGTDDESTTLYGKAVWGNFDFDNQYELFIWDGIINKDGTDVSRITNKNNHTNYWGESSSHLIIGDVNGDYNNDLIRQNSSELQLITYAFDNQLPSITEVSWDTGNPVCVNESVNYEIEFNDNENGYVRIVSDCLDDGVLNNGTLYQSGTNAQISCFYNSTGSISSTLYIQDTSHLNNFEVYHIHSVTVTTSEFCNSEGEQGDSTEGSITGVSGGLDDWASNVPSALDDFGFKSTASKVFFGILVIIGLIFAVNQQYKNAFVSVLVAILGMIGLTYLGIFPIWLIFLVFMFCSILVYIAIFKFSSGSEE